MSTKLDFNVKVELRHFFSFSSFPSLDFNVKEELRYFFFLIPSFLCFHTVNEVWMVFLIPQFFHTNTIYFFVNFTQIFVGLVIFILFCCV